tara:strand:- start:1088 stop:1315 length:228 start_codon:yes stop_codon:yes gene_type:complete
MGGTRNQNLNEKAAGNKFGNTYTPPPVESQKKPEPDREQVGMTTQRKKTEQTKKQQKASLTGTSMDDAGKTVLGG